MPLLRLPRLRAVLRQSRAGVCRHLLLRLAAVAGKAGRKPRSGGGLKKFLQKSTILIVIWLDKHISRCILSLVGNKIGCCFLLRIYITNVVEIK